MLTFLGTAFISGLLFPSASIAAITSQQLKDTEAKVLKIVRKTMPCTVSLIPGGPVAEAGSGSGVVVSEDGLILTAAHVTNKMNDKVTVIFPDGKRVGGKVLGMDFVRDASMVQITDEGNILTSSWAIRRCSNPMIGVSLWAIPGDFKLTACRPCGWGA